MAGILLNNILPACRQSTDEKNYTNRDLLVIRIAVIGTKQAGKARNAKAG